ncbi:aldo/keto reductase [Belnapia sp. T6]|uniref:Aldo/keto reductase n=1 Tax=Belnapia mucosa TaxID=2804532 RepID=A0ABS1V3J8_9PROT|nr:aldo/keto reductase [Belnapia mucosa]MBL6456265.1 aldo/keto reductase [Belnapia mucosa]
MEQRVLGRTGLRVSVLGYGAGAVGGLMVRGSAADQERSLARALEAGITYVDTAPAYGNGASERNLGRVLKSLGARPVLGTKIRLPEAAPRDIAGAITASLEASLQRLGRDHVDLYQLHDPIGVAEGYAVEEVLAEAVPALQRLRDGGKCSFLGITALGATPALRQVLEAGVFDTAQIPYNALNPSWLGTLPPGLPGQDFARLGERASGQGVGLIGIRILAAGALSGEAARHPVAMPEVAPIASAPDYATDLAHARRLLPLVEAGEAASLAELAIRFAITPAAMGTALIGTASLDQLEAAIAAAERGPLPPPVLERMAALLA